MKKFMLAAAVLVAASTMVSCGGKNPADKAIDMTNEATAALEKAANAEEAQKIFEDYTNKMTELAKENAGYEASEDQQKALAEAAAKMGVAYQEAMTK